MIGYVVESPAIHHVTGRRVGTMRVYVTTEERARQLVGEHPERTYRAIDCDDMPEKARHNMLGGGR